MKDWTNREVNPLGLELVDQQPKAVNVTVKAWSIAQFKDADGRTYICASVGERPRVVFESTGNGYIEVADDRIKFVAAAWTEEIINAKMNS